MADLKTGDAVFDENNDFIGTYVKNLSDFEGTAEEIENFKKSLLDSGPKEKMKSKISDLDQKEMYGYRKVCNENKVSVEQVLVKTFDSLSWTNVDMKNYTFEAIDKPKIKVKKENKKGRSNRIR